MPEIASVLGADDGDQGLAHILAVPVRVLVAVHQVAAEVGAGPQQVAAVRIVEANHRADLPEADGMLLHQVPGLLTGMAIMIKIAHSFELLHSFSNVH